MDPQKTKAAQLEAREMFFEDPSLSIDKVAAALDKKHIGLRRDELSRIRQEVRMRVHAAGNNPNSPVLAVSPETARRIQPLIRRHGAPHPPPTPMPSVTIKTAQPTEPFNPPHIEASRPAEVANVASTAVAGQNGANHNEEVPVAKPATQEERLKWLQDWLLDNVETASVGKARTAMLKKFGPGLAFGSQTVNIYLKQALEAAGMKPRLSVRAKSAAVAANTSALEQAAAAPIAGSQLNVTPIRTGPPKMEEALRQLAHLMRIAGIQRVELEGSNMKVTRAQPQEFSFKVT